MNEEGMSCEWKKASGVAIGKGKGNESRERRNAGGYDGYANKLGDSEQAENYKVDEDNEGRDEV